MHFSNAHKLSGFTQLEISITVIIVGILSAIALPSFLGWYGTKQVEEALTELQGFLQEAQVNAIRSCPHENCGRYSDAAVSSLQGGLSRL